MQDDQHNRSGIFFTNQKGLVPPLVTTNFITQDQGNASPRYIRSSMYNVPATIDMMKQVRSPTQIFYDVEDTRNTVRLIIHAQIIWFADYLCMIISCLWLMTEVGNK
jgi:hypothetical protein